MTTIANIDASIYDHLADTDDPITAETYDDILTAARPPEIEWADIRERPWYYAFGPEICERIAQYYTDDPMLDGILTILFADVDAARSEDWYEIEAATFWAYDGTQYRWDWPVS